MKIVILVPWRGGEPHRELAWARVRPHLEQLGWPIFTGDAPGPWNRSAAINAAAAEAGDWDVAMIADSDTLDDLSAVMKAATMVAARGGAVVPWNVRWKLHEKASREWNGSPPQRTHLDRRDRTPARLAVERRGGTIVVSREAWDAVRGFDEQFVGWGYEDVAFRFAVKTLSRGGLREIRATCVHLWHPRGGTHSEDGKIRWQMYRAVAGKPAQMRAMLQGLETVSVSVLVPFRDDGERGPAWEWCERRWRAILPHAEIVVGHDDGEPYSKTTAVNDAFSRASGDVLVVADADCFPDYASLETGIFQALHTNRLVVPWRVVYRLSREDSDHLLAQDPTTQPDREMISRVDAPSPPPITAGTMFIISRTAFQRVQGMDPRFRGWGYEDVSFRRCCDAMLRRTIYLAGEVWCFYHSRPKTRQGRVWGAHDPGKLNQLLNMLYMRSERRPNLMKELVAQHPLGEEPKPARLPSEPGRTHVARVEI